MPKKDEDRDDEAEDYGPKRARRRRDDDDAEDEIDDPIAEEEDDDGRPLRRRRGSVVDSIIPYKNGMALAAYYCGIFSLIPCLWGTLSIVAIVLGILGLGKAKKHPESKGTGHAIAGIVLGSISIILGIATGIYFAIVAR